MPHSSTFGRLAFGAIVVCAIGVDPSVAAGNGTNASFPSRQILILEPFGVGGGPDLLARALAEKLTEILHQSVDVQNVVGEGATAAPSTAAKLPADGYTLLINTNAQAYSRAARTDLNYDPIADFVPVRTLTEQPYVLVTGKGTGIHSLSNLIAKAKNQPQIVTFGSTGVGTGTHIGGEMLNRQAGLHARHVPPGPTEAISDVLVDVALGKFTYCFAPITLALPAIRAGDLVPLGTSTRNRSRLLPNVPTIAEAGVPRFNFPLWYGIWVRSGTPSNRIAKLDRALAAAMSKPAMHKWLQAHGAEPLHLSQAQFRILIQTDCHQAAKILKSNRC